METLAPPANELMSDLASKALDAPQILQRPQTSTLVTFLRAYIVPPSLVHPLLAYSFFSPTTLWYLLATRSRSLGQKQKVDLYMDLLFSRTIHGQDILNVLVSINTDNITLKTRQGLKYVLLLPHPPPTLPALSVRYLPTPPSPNVETVPPKTMVPEECWLDDLRSLLCL